MIPLTISHYRIIKKIGAGGMGEVLLAEDTKLRRKVALKLLSSELTKNEDRMRRFEQEAQAASALNHPNILTIYEVGEQDGTHFIATEFVEGETLRLRLQHSKMSIPEVLDVAIQVASALSAAHQAGIVHRDIKPENIMLRTDGYVKLLDFGIAKLTQSFTDQQAADLEAETLALYKTEPGIVIGTIKYMSPEQARGIAVDTRSDIFSFGVVLYEAISGQAPFKGTTGADTLVAILESQPPPLVSYLSGAPIELEHVVSRCLEKDRERRYQSAQELVNDFKNLASGRSKERLVAKPSPSIAVLPFANMSADPENEYFCDGLAEELLNALSKFDGLRVAARTSSFSFKGKEVDIREIGQKLNVNTILEGSVRKAGNRLRVTTQLISVTDGYHLWSERYDRQMEDVFEVQDEITLAIVEVLKVKLLGDDKAAVLKRYTDNAEAYQLYLKGRYYYNKWTEEGLKKSIEYYEQAINIETDYAPAYAEIANSYGTLVYFGHVAPTEILPLMSVAVEKSLQLDDTVEEAHLTVAKMKFFYEWDFPGAEREFKRAIDLNPNHAEARLFYSFYLSAEGRDEEALIEGKRGQELDPLSLNTSLNLGFLYYFAERYDQAAEYGNNMLEMEPSFFGAHWLVGAAYTFIGKFDEAIAAYKKALGLGGGPIVLGFLGFAYAASGRRGDALQVIEQLNQMREQRYLPAYHTAIVYAGLGEKEEAFKWLEKAYEERNGPLATLSRDKAFASLRSDPRFQNLLSRIGLPQ